jgi:tetratricopeptide (TPR) repeat protein/tRNA A-37 threonylcarbamoyl transferase component Bud32
MTDKEAVAGVEAIRYRTLRPHARGGLGEVFLAEDMQFQRHVALKELRNEHHGNAIRRERFLIEARITGRLEHPGVVPVYGMGTHADGRVFYAMRLIRGENLRQAITRFHMGPAPDFTGLEFRFLLNRFIAVCNTVAYAHEQGVLHRDLKPSNIMLGDFGETLVVDWGIAKLIGVPESSESVSSGDDRTVSPTGSITIQGQVVGSPAYMSPEQAAGNLDQVGRSSDIYCLGATLYQMLTERTPCSGRDDEVLRKVREGDFPRPRHVDPRIPAALEAICCKAMALKPEARYQSALVLAKDIECWLADRPVSAHRESWADKTRRWMRRNQTAVSGLAAAVTVGFLALGTAFPLLSYAWRAEAMAHKQEQLARAIAVQNLEKAQEQRSLAMANENKAAEERDRAESALQFLVQAFRKPDPAAEGRALKVVDLLNRAAREVDVAFADSPLVRGTLLQAIGETFSGLGLPQESLSAFQRVVDLRRQTLGPDDPETLASMSHLAAALQDAGRVDEAISLYESTLSKRTAVLGEKHPTTVETLNDLAVAYQDTGQYHRAIPLYQKVLEQMRVTLGEDHIDTLTVTDNLAVAFAAVGDPDSAIPLHEGVLARLRVKLGNEHPTTLVTMNNLAKAYEIKARHGDAILLFKKALELVGPKLGLDHPYRLSLLFGLAMARFAAGQKAEALELYEETLARRRDKLGGSHPDTVKTGLALAKAHLLLDQPEKAVPLAEEFAAKAFGIRDRLPERSRQDLLEVARRLVDHFTRIGREGQAKAYRTLLEQAQDLK